MSGNDENADKVMKRWKAGSEALSKERRDYWTHLAFYLGEQWCWWDDKRNLLQSFPQKWSPLGPGRARLTINRVASNMSSLLGRLLKTELAFEVPPTGSSDDVMQAARLAEKIVEAYHDQQDWENTRYDELFASFMGAVSAVAIEWDGKAGIPIDRDPETGKITVGTGDVSLQPLNVTEFCVEPFVRDFRQARWWEMGLVVPPDYAKDCYGLSWLPSTDGGMQYSPLQHKLLMEQGKPAGNDVCLVVTHYERPNPSCPKGSYSVVINNRTVHEEAWPDGFPTDRLNLELFTQRRVSGRWQGSTLMSDAIGLQFAYNHARSVLHEHLKTAGIARLMAPRGAFDEDDWTDNPNKVVWFQPDLAGVAPKYLETPTMSSWIAGEAEKLGLELDDVMHVHGPSRGEGFDRASGSALAILTEKDDSPLGPMARQQSKGWSNLASTLLQLLEKKATETRSLNRRLAKGIAEPVKFNGAMLKGQTNVRVPLESTLPRSQAGQAQFAKDLWDRHIITDPREYARQVGLPPDEFEDLLDPDASRAQHENFRLSMGEVEFPESFDNHAIHIAEHNRYRKSDAYRFAAQDIRDLFDHHIAFHEQKAAEERVQQQIKAIDNQGLAEAPQGAEPPGSGVPPTAQEQQAAAAAQAPAGGGQQPQLGPGGAPTPGMDQLGMSGQ